jgi:hypothetical protein
VIEACAVFLEYDANLNIDWPWRVCGNLVIIHIRDKLQIDSVLLLYTMIKTVLGS